MTKEQYLAAVRAVDGIREEEDIIRELENMVKTTDYDSLNIRQTRTDKDHNFYANTLDIRLSDLQIFLDIHKQKKEQYEKDFIAI